MAKRLLTILIAVAALALVAYLLPDDGGSRRDLSERDGHDRREAPAKADPSPSGEAEVDAPEPSWRAVGRVVDSDGREVRDAHVDVNLALER